MIAWWYTTAWFKLIHDVQHMAARVLDTFSVGLLLRTLFAPFRQIDAGGVRGPIGIQLRAWFDRTFSRFIGFGIRTTMIIVGGFAAVIMLCLGAVWALVWLCLPVLPVIGLVLTLSGRTL